jgi:hypothetical protein
MRQEKMQKKFAPSEQLVFCKICIQIEGFALGEETARSQGCYNTPEFS